MDLQSWLEKHGKGSAVRLASGLGLSTQTVYAWRDGMTIPAHWVLPIWAFTSGEVHPYDTRPDIYPPDVVTFNLEAWVNHTEAKKGKDV